MRVVGNAVAAKKPEQKYKPYFTVFQIEGTTTKRVAKMVKFGNRVDKDGNPKNLRLEYEDVEMPLAYLVTFPKGHSIHIDSYEKLEAMGFTDTEVPLVDEDGEAVGSLPNRIRKMKKAEVIDNA